MLVVHPSLPVKSVKELIALAKSRPGQIVYASSGNGTILHLAGETFKSMAGIDLMHVPYKGSAQAMQALLAGEVALIVFDHAAGAAAGEEPASCARSP